MDLPRSMQSYFGEVLLFAFKDSEGLFAVGAGARPIPRPFDVQAKPTAHTAPRLLGNSIAPPQLSRVHIASKIHYGNSLVPAGGF